MRHTLSRLWRRITRRPEQTISTTLVIDTVPFSEQMRRLGESWQIMRDTLGRQLLPPMTAAAAALATFARQISPYIRANEPVHVAGLEARYFVRAGLDPQFAEPHMLDSLVQSILNGVSEDELWLLTDENRALIAASAIAGWCHSHVGTNVVRVLAWHRQMPDGQRLSVGRAS